MGDKTANNEICPLVTNPFRECFCFETNSQNAEMALDFCGANYRQCKIYQKHGSKGDLPHHDDVGSQLQRLMK